ncbi:MAG TPA: hypothetical protein VNA69_17535 [Thermoanaerobaculia bacterium]|nr:hypothetical protein [Thermoanaerobaculia bacterium]
MRRLALALLVAASWTADVSSAPAQADGTSALRFIEDDYAKAAARAKAKNIPIFVETWAPW